MKLAHPAILFVSFARVSEFDVAHVYVITNTINGKQYVGATKYTIERRFKEHIKESRRKRCKNRPLYKDINKYGSEYFIIEELEECLESDKFNRECYWIEKLNTYVDGYNLTYGGAGKQFYNYKEIANKYLELGTVEEVSKYFDCDVYTVRIACRENNVNILSGSEQVEISQSKPVNMIDKDTNKVLKVFSSTNQAALYLGSKSMAIHIADVCKGKRKTAYGYKWEYVER